MAEPGRTARLAPPYRLYREKPRRSRRFPRRRACRRGKGQRRAGLAPPLPSELLRGVCNRPRRTQYRGGLPQCGAVTCEGGRSHSILDPHRRSLKPSRRGEVQWRQSKRPSTASVRSTSTHTNMASSPTSNPTRPPRASTRTSSASSRPRRASRQWMLDWRLEAYRRWLTMGEPTLGAGRISRDRLPGPLLLLRAEVDGRAEVARRGRSGAAARPTTSSAFRWSSRRSSPASSGPQVAVDAVFDSVSVATTFKAELAKAGVIFMPFSEAVREHPELVKKYLGSVVPPTDNFFATLNSAVFSDGSFVYVPPGVRCPMELSTYFRINEKNTGQFERTLIIADKGAYVSYLEGCTAPQARREPAARRGGRTGRARRRRDQIFDGAELVSRRRRGQAAASTISSPSAATAAARARRSPGPRSRPARRSPGNIRAASCAATIRAANSIRSRSPTAASRSIPAPR